jgi:L-fuconolactonase
VIVIDSHCHAGIEKYEPLEVLLFQMDRIGIGKAIVVQHFGQYDNTYLLNGARQFPGRFAIIGLVDANKPDAAASMERCARMGLQGIRLKPTWRSPGKDPLAIWRKAAELDLRISCRTEEEELIAPEFHELIKAFPTLKIVIEHLGEAERHKESLYTDFNRVTALAKYDNVYMKVPGYGELCKPPFPYKEIPPFMKMAVQAFGAQRLMWGSDWPPVVSREGYYNSLHFTMQNFPASDAEKEWIFGRTALSLFKFDA